jgi:hypothetical protein
MLASFADTKGCLSQGDQIRIVVNERHGIKRLLETLLQGVIFPPRSPWGQPYRAMAEVNRAAKAYANPYQALDGNTFLRHQISRQIDNPAYRCLWVFMINRLESGILVGVVLQVDQCSS